MFYRTLLPADVLAQLERMQRAAQHNLDYTPSIRGANRSGYPAMNVGLTPRSVEVFAFAPGLDPASIDVQIEKGILTVAGERASLAPPKEAQATLHIDERFSGRFRRVVSLPDDIDPNAVSARYRDGVLHVSVARRETSQPRRIDIQ